MSRLKEASDELVYARYEHDNQLMYKFSGILNEKKSDIRKKQRLLSTVTGDLSNGMFPSILVLCILMMETLQWMQLLGKLI